MFKLGEDLFPCLQISTYVTSEFPLTANNNPNKVLLRENIDRVVEKAAFAQIRIFWRPHVLDNDQLTVGHELIMLDAEICIPCGIKQF